MADRNGPAVHVQHVVRNAQPVAAIHHLAGERLVQFPQVDVVHAQAGALQQLRHREHRPDAHLVRFAAGHGHAAVDAQRLQPALLGLPALHQHAHRGAVGQLAGVAGGDEAALAHHGRQRGQPRGVRVRPVALVAVDGDVLARALARLLVREQLGDVARDEFIVEAAGLLRRGGAVLALQRVCVLGLAGDVVAFGHDLGRVDHGHVQVRRLPQSDGVLVAVFVLMLVLHQADGFQSAGHDRPHAVADDLFGRGGDAHQPGRTLPVDRLARHRDGQPRGHGALSGHVEALRAFLQRRAHDDVVDLARLDLGAPNGFFDDRLGHGRRGGVVERPAVRLADGRPRGGYDDGFSHDSCSSPMWR